MDKLELVDKEEEIKKVVEELVEKEIMKEEVVEKEIKNVLTEKEKEIFLVIFVGSLWQRAIYCAEIYSNYKGELLTTSTVFKCLKYNILCPKGLFNFMKPYLEKIYKTGFLLPHEYKNNMYISRAINYYSIGYNTFKYWPEFPVNYHKFVKDYLLYLAAETKVKTNKHEEMEDLLQNQSVEEFCDLIDEWDLDLFLYSAFSDSLTTDILLTLAKTISR